MDKKKEILKLDFYSILDIPPNATEKQIRKAFRKKAILWHPDKNPDNPNAAEKFVQLKSILEILLDIDNKASYDKLLKGRKEAEIRARNFSAKTKSLKNDLEKREKEAEEAKEKRREDQERGDIRSRLKAENARIIAEELDRIDKELKAQRDEVTVEEPKNDVHRVKAKWKKTANWQGFTKEDIQRIFYKWGEINAVVMTEKGSKGTALIDYKEKSGADMAVSYEIGPAGTEIEVSYATKPKKSNEVKLRKPSDTETIYEMNQRRALERQKIMEEMRANEA